VGRSARSLNVMAAINQIVRMGEYEE